jgi:hypothetical protein
MKTMFRAAIIAITVMVSAVCANAGVVVSETETTSMAGKTSIANKTIYVQGNKQKIDTPDQETIIDLDSGLIYKVDYPSKTYQTALIEQAELKPSGTPAMSLQLHKTGQERRVAGQPCTNFQGASRVSLMSVSVRVCVAKNIPGSDQIAAFQRSLISRLIGADEDPTANVRGLPVEEETTMRVRYNATQVDRASRDGLAVRSETRVERIQLKPLNKEFFQPPADFHATGTNAPSDGIDI